MEIVLGAFVLGYAIIVAAFIIAGQGNEGLTTGVFLIVTFFAYLAATVLGFLFLFT